MMIGFGHDIARCSALSVGNFSKIETEIARSRWLFQKALDLYLTKAKIELQYAPRGVPAK